MLKPNEIEKFSTILDKPVKALENEIMEDIVRRIKINGEITRSADWQMHRLYEMGMAKDDIQKAIKNNLNLSDEDIHEMYVKAVKSGYVRDKEIYMKAGVSQIPFAENLPLQQLISAVAEQTSGQMKNLSQSLGFAVRQPDGTLAFTGAEEFYQQTLDNAIMGISNGAFDYVTAIKKAILTMTNSGLRTVDYATGWSNRTAVAARRAVVTGLSQITAKVNEDNAKALKTEYFEVTWHSGARPTHQEWQGKVYTKSQLETVCGLGTVTGLCGANCYHDYYPFIPGISERTYTDEQLEKLNAEDNKKREYQGKEYTKYEALQRQRHLETSIRAKREQIHLLEVAEVPEEDIINARCRYQGTLQEYNRFSREMNLPVQRDRIYVDGWGNMSVGKKKYDFSVKPGYDARAKANLSVINSDKYVEKFSEINVSNIVKEKISDLSAKLIKRRDETYIEEIYAIQRDNGKILSYIKGKAKFGVNMNENFIRVLTNSPEGSIIILHNHPIDFTFSTSDVETASKFKSIGTIIASTHAGNVSYAEGIFNDAKQLIKDYRIAYTKNIKLGRADSTARILAWKDSFGKAGIKYDVK